MTISPVAEELNKIISESSPAVFSLLSNYGKRIFFPKGIVSQSAEAKEKASLFNATIGIAKENGVAMKLSSVEEYIHPDLGVSTVLPYAPSGGVDKLRKLWEKRQREAHPELKSSSLPIVTSGLTHGLSLTGELFLNPGDTVVLPEMFWGNYKLMWQVRGEANFVTYPFFDEKLERFNLEGFKKTLNGISSKKIFLPLNFPHNPTGYSLTTSESEGVLKTLKTLAESGKEIITVCDDAYWGLVYEEGYRKESLFSSLASLHPNLLAVRIDGATKELFMWGMRVGFLSFASKGMSEEAYRALEKKASAALRAGVSNVTHHSQVLVYELLQKKEMKEESKEKHSLLESRYRAVKEEVYKEEYKNLWDVYSFNSGYFMCLRLKNGVDAETFRVHLLEKYGIGVVSLGGSNLRIAFSCVEKDSIKTLFEKIAEALH